METIIVTTDFSDISNNAVHYAVDFAAQIHADILLLHVVTLPIMVSEIPLPYDGFEADIANANLQMEQLKQALMLRSKGNITINARVETASLLNELNDLVKDYKPIAIIMGSKGETATTAFFLGSSTLTIADNLNCPLLIIPPEAKFNDIKKIGMACDMKDVSANIPLIGLHLLYEHFNAELKILFISNPSENEFPTVLPEAKFLQDDLAKYHPEICISSNKNIAEGINEFAQKTDLDLLLVIPKKRGMLAAIFHKSISKKIILNPTIPMMILHQ